MTTKSVHKLNTAQASSKALLLALLVIVSLLLVNCGKKCQTNTNSVKSLSEAGVRWRMIDTNDKSAELRKLNNYNFTVWSFDNAFRGQVIAVRNNEEFSQNPLCTLTYLPERDQKRMAVEFKSTSTQAADPGGAGTTSGCPVSGRGTFDYSIGKNLRVTNVKTGVYYNFVQYLGIVEPDKACTF